MAKKKIKLLPTQVFYTSKEETNSPLLVDLIKIAKELKEKKIIENKTDTTISLTYGKRVLINSFIQDYSKIKKEEIIEIVDYDPIKNNLLLIGTADPKDETALHFMIHHARKEIKIIVQINEEKLLEKIKNKPILDDKLPINSIDFIKLVLKNLRENKIIGMKNHGLLIVAKNKEELENITKKYLEE